MEDVAEFVLASTAHKDGCALQCGEKPKLFYAREHLEVLFSVKVCFDCPRRVRIGKCASFSTGPVYRKSRLFLLFVLCFSSGPAAPKRPRETNAQHVPLYVMLKFGEHALN